MSARLALAVLVLLVLGTVAAVFAVGHAVTAPQPTSSTSVRSTP